MVKSATKKRRDAEWIELTPSWRYKEITNNFLLWALRRKWVIPVAKYNVLLNRKKIVLSEHSKYRISERLNLDWVELERVKDDLRWGIEKIDKAKHWRYIIYWKLARYIVSKEKIIITILPLF